jgi:hypothetical protein
MLRVDDTTLTASSHGFGREHTPAPEATCEDVRGRTSRVVLTPGAFASSLAVIRVAQPGAHISHPQGDGGNSASLPGESTKDTLKPSRREGRAIRRTCGPPRVHFYGARTCGCQPAPGLPCALVFTKALARDKNSGETRRESASARALFETCSGTPLVLPSHSLSSPGLSRCRTTASSSAQSPRQSPPS